MYISALHLVYIYLGVAFCVYSLSSLLAVNAFLFEEEEEEEEAEEKTELHQGSIYS